MAEDLNKTRQDLKPPRMSWYEQERRPMGDDKQTTITLNWSKVGPMIGLVVFIGGLVTTSVNAAISVAQYKAQIEATERKVDEQQAALHDLQAQVTRLSAVQDFVERLQSRMAVLENAETQEVEEAADRTSYAPSRTNTGRAARPRPTPRYEASPLPTP